MRLRLAGQRARAARTRSSAPVALTKGDTIPLSGDARDKITRASGGAAAWRDRPHVNPALDVIEQAYITVGAPEPRVATETRAAEVLGIDPSTLYRKLSALRGAAKPDPSPQALEQSDPVGAATLGAALRRRALQPLDVRGASAAGSAGACSRSAPGSATSRRS